MRIANYSPHCLSRAMQIEESMTLTCNVNYKNNKTDDLSSCSISAFPHPMMVKTMKDVQVWILEVLVFKPLKYW